MGQWICYIISISFQVAGALILLVNSLKKGKKQIYASYFANAPKHVFGKDGMVTLEKEKLQEHARKLYIDRVAFVYLILGYLLAVFGDIGSNKKFVTALSVIVCSTLLLGIGNVIGKEISKLVYNDDRMVDGETVMSLGMEMLEMDDN